MRFLDDPTLFLERRGNQKASAWWTVFGSLPAVILAPLALSIASPAFADAYEDDDTWDTASWIAGDGQAQTHMFDDAGDADYVRFYAFEEVDYTLETLNLGLNCDTVLTLFDTDGVTQLAENDDFVGFESVIAWECPADGTYFLRAKHHNPATFGEGTEYDLRVTFVEGPSLPGTLVGQVEDEATGLPIADAQVSAGANDTTTTANGEYLFPDLDPNTYTVSVQAAGYQAPADELAVITAHGIVELDFLLSADPALPAPTGVNASDGTYADRVEVTWNPVAGATQYRVYRATADNASLASPLSSWQAGTSYNDTTAVTQASSGCSGGSGIQYYWYWVKAMNAVGSSLYSDSDRGHRAASKELSGTTPAAMLPHETRGDLLLMAAAAVVLAILARRRISCDSFR